VNSRVPLLSSWSASSAVPSNITAHLSTTCSFCMLSRRAYSHCGPGHSPGRGELGSHFCHNRNHPPPLLTKQHCCDASRTHHHQCHFHCHCHCHQRQPPLPTPPPQRTSYCCRLTPAHRNHPPLLITATTHHHHHHHSCMTRSSTAQCARCHTSFASTAPPRASARTS
jgi:hypothetical protein